MLLLMQLSVQFRRFSLKYPWIEDIFPRFVIFSSLKAVQTTQTVCFSSFAMNHPLNQIFAI